MVNMIGFNQKQPFERIPAPVLPGEPGWYMRVHPRPRLTAPLRARVHFSGGWATFDSPDDARVYLGGDQSVSVETAARAYLEHFGEELQ